MSFVVVTGASQGIGAAVATRLASPGTSVALVARSEDKLRDVAEQVEGQGGTAHVLPCDVTDVEAVRRMAAEAVDRGGVPDVLVNNAGLFIPGSVAETDVATFRQQIEVNLTSAFVVTRAFLSGMQKRGSGHLLFMASVASIKGYPGGVAYCAGKHGLLGLARAVREETRKDGIRVTALLPGATLTPSWDGSDIPEDRFMPKEDIAEAVASAIAMSPRTMVEEILLRPQEGDI